MTPEGRTKEAIKKVLKQFGVYWHMPVQNGMGSPTLDFICCYNGHYLAIEAKAPGKTMTPRQQQTSLAITQAHGTVFEIADELGVEMLRSWLENHRHFILESKC